MINPSLLNEKILSILSKHSMILYILWQKNNMIGSVQSKFDLFSILYNLKRWMHLGFRWEWMFIQCMFVSIAKEHSFDMHLLIFKCVVTKASYYNIHFFRSFEVQISVKLLTNVQKMFFSYFSYKLWI